MLLFWFSGLSLFDPLGPITNKLFFFPIRKKWPLGAAKSNTNNNNRHGGCK